MPKEETTQKAKALARVIIQEMSFPVQPCASDKARLVGRLHDSIPTREALSFQQQGAAAKTLLGEEWAADEEEMLKLFFCVFHDAPSAETDHVFSFNKIRQKQIKLLEFLNTDREFADAFLDQPGIIDYFKRDTDGLVKGTSYFFKLCYNDIGNLRLICHTRNVQKIIDDPLDWFRQQDTYFGQPFLASIREWGDYHEGVFLGKVYLGGGSSITLNLLGESIDLHTGDSQGLCKLAREWFSSRFQSILDVHREFYGTNYQQFKKTLNRIRSLILDGKTDAANKVRRQLRKTLTALQGAYEGCMPLDKEKGSHLISDDSVDKAAQHRISAYQSPLSIYVTHELNKIKTLFVPYYGAAQAEAFRQRCIEHHGVETLSWQAWKEIFESLDSLIFDAKASGEMPSVEAVGKTITRLYDGCSQQELRKRAEAAEERAERETRENTLLRARIAVLEAAQRQQGFFGERIGDRRGEKRSSDHGNPQEAKRDRGEPSSPTKSGVSF